MWMPRLPDVFGNPRCPARRAAPRASCAAPMASSKSVPGCGSRSIRSSSGWSTSSRRTGHGWKTIVPICAAQAATAGSVGQTSSAVRPDGNVDLGRLDVRRGALGHPLLVERVAVAALPGRQRDPGVDALGPALQGRRPVPQRAVDLVADAGVVLHHVELGRLGRRVGRGKITRSGLVTRTGSARDLDLGGWSRHAASVVRSGRQSRTSACDLVGRCALGAAAVR